MINNIDDLKVGDKLTTGTYFGNDTVSVVEVYSITEDKISLKESDMSFITYAKACFTEFQITYSLLK